MKKLTHQEVIQRKAFHIAAGLRSISQYTDTHKREELLKVVYHTVKYFSVKGLRMPSTFEEAINEFSFADCLKNIIAGLAPNELMRIFPVTKYYGGKNDIRKDYYFTMDVLRNHGLDTPFYDKIEDILWDYMNPDIRIFNAAYHNTVQFCHIDLTGMTTFEAIFSGQDETALRDNFTQAAERKAQELYS